MSHRATVGVFIVSVAVQATGYAATFFLAHRIGVDTAGLELLGTVGLFLLIAGTITNLGELRLGIAYIYYTSKGEAPSANMGTYFAGILVAASASCVFIAIVAGPLLSVLSVHDPSAFWLFLTLPVLGTTQNLYTNHLVATGRATQGQYPFLVRSSIQLVLLVPVAFLWPTITGIAVAYFIGYFSVCLWTTWKIAPYVLRPTWASFRKMMDYSWPLVGSMGFVYLSNNVMPYIVSSFLGTAPVALYLAGNGLRVAAFTLSSAVCVPLFPLIAREFHDRGAGPAGYVASKAVLYTNVLVAPVAVVMAVLAPTIVTLLYGNGYRGASEITTLLMLTVVPSTTYQILSNVLWAIGKQRLELYVTALQVGTLTTSFLLIPLWGLPGAGAAMVVSSVVGMCLNIYFTRRFGLVVSLRTVVGPFLAAMVFVPLVWVPNHLIFIAAGVCVATAAYGWLVIRSRIVDFTDLKKGIDMIPLPSGARRWAERLVVRMSPV